MNRGIEFVVPQEEHPVGRQGIVSCYAHESSSEAAAAVRPSGGFRDTLSRFRQGRGFGFHRGHGNVRVRHFKCVALHGGVPRFPQQARRCRFLAERPCGHFTTTSFLM